MTAKERSRYVSLLNRYQQLEAGLRERAKADPDDMYARRQYRAVRKHRAWLQARLREGGQTCA